MFVFSLFKCFFLGLEFFWGGGHVGNVGGVYFGQGCLFFVCVFFGVSYIGDSVLNES